MMIDLLHMMSPWQGGFGRPLTDNCVSMPDKLSLRSDRLIYSGASRIKRIRLNRLLDDFLWLADERAKPADVLAFAVKYAPLYVCEHHGIAAYHRPLLMTYSPVGPRPVINVDHPFRYGWCRPRLERRHPDTFSEDVKEWFSLARRATSLLRIANAIRSGRKVDSDLWEKTDGFSGTFAQQFGPRWAYLDEPWHRLAANLECWIISADISLRVTAGTKSLVVSLGPTPFTYSPFALITLQMILAIMHAEGLVSCSGCGTLFISSRPPLAGRLVGPQLAKRNYCQTCRMAKIPQRDAARDYRRRRKQ